MMSTTVEKASGAGFKEALGRAMYRYGLLIVWLVLVIVFSLLVPSVFFTVGTFQTIFDSQASLVFLTLGLVISLCVGEFDLSVAGVMTLSLVLIGYLDVLHGVPILMSVAMAVGAGLVVGSINAFLVLVVGVESIIVTLGMGTLLMGLSSAINNVTTPGISPALIDLVRGDVFGVQLGSIYAVLITAVVWYVLAYTPVGRYLYFVGQGADVARLAGINVSRIRAGALVTTSLMAALAGVVAAGTLGASDPTFGASFLLPAFAGAFLGATVIVPGRFNAWGAWIAVYFLVTGITGLQAFGLSGWIGQVFYGASLIVAVGAARIVGRSAPHAN